VKLLAIETATDACSCALYLDGVVHESHEIAPQRHAELILDMVSRLLTSAELTLRELEALAFGRGPGSFTGLRIAAGVIQGLAYGAELPVVAVSTLQALAQGAHRDYGVRRAATALDARMGEVYWGAFELDAREIMVPVVAECVTAPGKVPLPPGSQWLGTGGGWGPHAEALTTRCQGRVLAVNPETYPRARDVAHLGAQALACGQTCAPSDALPVYLRDRVTTVTANTAGARGAE
jgi:tRNA threonylcarbamoyladenosine biosynthesis protein TsaB